MVALLDGRQIPFAELGTVLRVAIQPTEARGLLVKFRDLPADGARHNLIIYDLPDRQYFEAPLGTVSPWYSFVRNPGRTSWQ